jgi:hypothetical protein
MLVEMFVRLLSHCSATIELLNYYYMTRAFNKKAPPLLKDWQNMPKMVHYNAFYNMKLTAGSRLAG